MSNKKLIVKIEKFMAGAARKANNYANNEKTQLYWEGVADGLNYAYKIASNTNEGKDGNEPDWVK